jgi:hypothetical protein
MDVDVKHYIASTRRCGRADPLVTAGRETSKNPFLVALGERVRTCARAAA